MSFNVTPAHADIFRVIEDPNGGNAIISAVAGAGKTSTLLECMRRIPSNKSVRFLVFNKRNADELTQRVPAHVQVQTLNSLGFAALRGFMRPMGLSPQIDARAVDTVTRQMLDAKEFRAYGSEVVRLVRLAKSAGMLSAHAELPRGMTWARAGIAPDTRDAWQMMADHFGIDVDEDGFTIDDAIDAASKVLARCAERMDSVIDFDDQLLLPFGLGARVPSADWTFVDEAQDLSPLQHALVKAGAGRGRVVAVGDERQAIYGWRGASSDSMQKMAQMFGMQPLPLHVSYRCPRSVVAVAQRYVAHIRAHESAPDGIVIEQPRQIEDAGAQPGDMVLCRTTAPVVRTAWALLRAGTPAVVLGRDIGSGLTALIKKLKASTLEDLEPRLEKWLEKEVAKADKANDAAKRESAEDRASTLRFFVRMASDLTDLHSKIESTFRDAHPASVVTCCTIHKAKGLEADRVFILDWHRMPPKWATQEWMQVQEWNIMYVAVTRARRHLQFALSPARDESEKAAPAQKPEDKPAEKPAEVQWVRVQGNVSSCSDDIIRLGGRVRQGRFGMIGEVPAEKFSQAQRIVDSVSASNARAVRRYR